MKVVLQFPSLQKKSASDHQCFLCVVWSRDEHFAAFIVESSLFRVIVKVFVFLTGSQTHSCLFFALFGFIVHTYRRHLKDVFEANSSAMHLHCVVS